MEWEKARFLMVEQQIRTWDVLNAAVLDRLFTIKREDFVPADKRELAFVDMELPLGVADAHMLQPKMEARIVQEVQVGPEDKVLVIGAGSGYLSALLGSFAKQVYAVEIQPELVECAQQNLQKAGLKNVSVELADGSQGFEKYAPYNIIVVTGSLPMLPEALKEQLAEGGRLFVVLGTAPDMKATLMTRKAEGGWEEKHLFETCLPALINAPQPARFVF
jgi:protein-L-isoaspartate(D-aspartate) O-methyltransferase